MATKERIQERVIDFKDKRKEITLTDPEPFVAAITSSPNPVVVFFSGTRGIDEFFDFAQRQLESSNSHKSVVMLKDFFDFDEKRLSETLRQLNQTDTKWVLFIPEWKTTGHYEPIERWADERGAIRFDVDPEGVPEVDFEEIRKLAPEPKQF